MAKVSLLLLALACLVSVCAAQLAPGFKRPQPKDVLLLTIVRNRVVVLNDEAKRFISQIEDPLRMVSFSGPVLNTNRMMHFVVNRPYEVDGPESYGVEFWPRLLNISVPHKTRLMSIHYDHDLSAFNGDPFTEAKMVAIMTLISSHMIYNFDHIQPRHPLNQFEFLTLKRIPALVLRDILIKKHPSQLTNINWPKIRSFLMAEDGSFKEFCKEHEFPEYLWPDLQAMFDTGRFGSKTVACGGFIEAMTKDHDSFEVVKDNQFVDLSKEVHHSSTGPNMIKFIEVLVDLVNEPMFANQYKERMADLKISVDKIKTYFERRFGSEQQHLGGHPTQPEPIEPLLPPKNVDADWEYYPGVTVEPYEQHEEL